MQEYTKEFFWNVYKTLPEELKEAIFDENNNQIIYNICSQLGLNEEQASLVAKYTGRVLMGLLPMKDFGVTLELELNIDEGLANKIYQAIDSTIFKKLRLPLSRLAKQKFGNTPAVQNTTSTNEPNTQTQTDLEFFEKDDTSSFPQEYQQEKLNEENTISNIQFPKIRPLFQEPIATKTAIEDTASRKNAFPNSNNNDFQIKTDQSTKPNIPPIKNSTSDDLSEILPSYESTESLANSNPNISPNMPTKLDNIPLPSSNSRPSPQRFYNSPQKTTPSPKQTGQFDPYREIPI
ncbi:MAG TPA: hypothetical protein PL093_00475 [Candidatus Pacearchaeota archaeon]|jgi:hypothetical protein|nr:hypothetical protein [Candidatus Pacearchaeota archaeon]HQG09064.1 hypothetical protein [Candidatus Pacearchaeota archaeon]HQH20038.1 hypothetical protein [Candidatus Pacearchaeota archaeon]HQK58223.1 hypothetical protein [Candidatus Pacearchaeota archaeon]HRU20594.1 hypothetical protein [Candidatus Paceibacterota bacterium]